MSIESKTFKFSLQEVERQVFPNIDIDTTDGFIFTNVRYFANTFWENHKIILENQTEMYFWIRDYRDKLIEEAKK